ncbi:unnamed protein product [Leptidea sinapis]|uniref:Phenoloxidase-activating factor 2 n=1 Tax=Leptidea sinapis TaxID=189913 RepID=A0A5E4QLM2_9NEOP|nr:unnamed protein product [Leptidea sinapis]
MRMLLIFLAVLSTAYCQDKSGDLDSVIREIFGNPSPSTPEIADKNQASTIVPPTQTTTSDSYAPCVMETGDAGQCVRYYLCNGNNSIITDGVGIIDIRVQDGPCLSYLDVCCSAPDIRKPDNPITPKPDVQPQRAGCGWRNPDGIGFKITGDKDGEAKFGEFPWTVAILKIEPVNQDDPNGRTLNVYVGGGSLIHPKAVLTAAHYVTAMRAMKIRAGEWDTQTTKEIYPYQDRDVEQVVVHKDFNKNNLFYDIALLFLSTPVELAPNVGVVCLPPPRERAVKATRCFASGWGKDKFGTEGRYQVILKKVEVPVVERSDCQKALRSTRLGNFFMLHSSFMCAGGEPGKDTCKGDGGSPLVCPIPYEADRYYQNGIVAWGIGCGEDSTPGVYVDVGNLREWIDDKMLGKGLDIKAYRYLIGFKQ